MTFLRIIPRVLGLFLLSLAPWSAQAQTTEWSCWYSLDQHVSCQLLQAPVATDLSDAEAVVVRMANAPSAPGFTVAVLRERPYALRSLLMRIPLWTEPVDRNALGELAQAVMCGTRLDCTASYGSGPVSSLAAAAAMADAWDPLLQPLR
ncbi:hypothetical protein BurJ1DRAFT_4196 [Burkholderiales bacterium JOSHI_001]|nr:hypothetical protein BurJ1DRAFT_4196 [Burkholderiales bacterium JOSHI_001]